MVRHEGHQQLQHVVEVLVLKGTERVGIIRDRERRDRDEVCIKKERKR